MQKSLKTWDTFFGTPGITVSFFFETLLGWVDGWLENPILMKTQSSVWTCTFDFDLWFVNVGEKVKMKLRNVLKNIYNKKCLK